MELKTKLTNFTNKINEIYFNDPLSSFVARFYTEHKYFDNIDDSIDEESIVIQFYDNISLNDQVHTLDKLCKLLNLDNNFSFYDRYNDLSDCYVMYINYDNFIVKYDSKEKYIQEITNILNRLLGE